MTHDKSRATMGGMMRQLMDRIPVTETPDHSEVEPTDHDAPFGLIKSLVLNNDGGLRTPGLYERAYAVDKVTD